VDIPVVIMGETGCGKTKLIEFMSKLQIPTALKKKLQTMVIVRVTISNISQSSKYILITFISM